MNKFAILGHCIRGIEVIAALESAGGKNHNNLKGSSQFDYYWIDPEDNTININSMQYIKSHYGVNEFYTLEEYEEYALKKSDSPEKECTDTTEALNFCQTLKELPVDVYYTSPIKEDIAHLPTLSTRETEDVSIGLVKEDKDRTRLIIPEGYELKTDGDNTYLVKSKPTYPKDYVECCECIKHNPFINNVSGYKRDTIEALQTLTTCRDAYWKLAGEEMGLGKPWKPDWNDCAQHKFGLYTLENEIRCINLQVLKNIILVFPTEEMRDAFYGNFKGLIEQCKELL